MSWSDDVIVELLRGILDELKKLNERKPRGQRQRTTLVNDGLPEIALLWNKHAHQTLPKVLEVSTSSARYKGCVARWNEKPSQEYWVRVIQKMNESSFCLGKNSTKWVADLEFLVRPDTSTKILEGKYSKNERKPEDVVVGYYTDADGNTKPLYKEG